MKINRMATEKLAPDWIFTQKNTAENLDKANVSNEEMERIASMPIAPTEDDLVSEKSVIEKCAASKKPYHFNAKWSDEVKSELKEYASICGMNESKLKPVDPEVVAEDIKTISSNVANSATVKTATKIDFDPFYIDKKLTDEDAPRIPWEKIAPQSKMAEKPTMSGIVPVRGGEDYFANSESKVAKGQNSISDPNAIGKFAENNVEDTGARLQREKQEKEDNKKTRHQDWEKEKLGAMADNKIPSRKVFPTESMNAQPGIKGKGVFDFDSIPTQTDGEKIKESNAQRKEQIRGKSKERHQFTVEKNPTSQISDTFAEELKKHLK